MAVPRSTARVASSVERNLLSSQRCRRSFVTVSTQQTVRLSRPSPLAQLPSRHRPSTSVYAKQQRRAQSTLTENAKPAPHFYTEEEPGKTALYDLHIHHGAKMVPFGGFLMPVQYSDLSVGESHHWTREKCSLFDVGHMVQYHVEGPGAEAFLESLTPAGVKDLAPGQSTLSALLHPVTGGMVDDCIITRLEEGPKHLFYVVLNAGCREKDYSFLSAAIDKWCHTMNPEVHLRHVQYDSRAYGLIALQGPLAVEILESTLASTCKVDLNTWHFGNAKHITLALPSGESHPIVASRGGYTGEDGFELSIHPDQTVEVTKALLDKAGKEKLRFAGLGARDSLRLEAGMCLYGHDLDDTTTPVEAGLSWIIPKSRRSSTTTSTAFNGAETIIPQLTPISKGGTGVQRRRVGLVVEGAPAREGAEIVDESGVAVGKVTSGCPSPTMGKHIAMAYVKNGMHKAGTELQVVVRGKKRKAVVTKMPFVASKYWKGGALLG